LHFHASLAVFRAVDRDLFDVGFLEVLAKGLGVPPHFVDHEEVAIEAIPVDVKLK
jgi:hypothetical protein